MREILKHVQDDTYGTLKCPEPTLILQTFLYQVVIIYIPA